MPQKHSLIRTIYLYLFALVGLTLVIIGVVRMLDMALKIYVFKEADKVENFQPAPPYPPYGAIESRPVAKEQGIGEVALKEKIELTSEEKTTLNNWVVEYKNWQENQAKINYVKARRQQEAANALAFMLVGIPLYLYHWAVIKRDRKNS